MKRRAFLQSMAVPTALIAGRRTLAAASSGYVVGVGNSSKPYGATRTAIAASGQFPSAAMAGQTVIIKPNLVIAAPSTSGITTDPQVVRAIVDLALDAGAARILIAEGSCVQPCPFGPCGYGFFQTYGPAGVISLVDLCKQSDRLVKVGKPGGMVYQQMWLPDPVTGSDPIFISAAKLKTHLSVGATLSMKCLVGMAPPSIYTVANQWPRQDLHYRGIAESIIDLNCARPIHFAVIDGIWGMEGEGPTSGTAVQADLVFAGLNPTAVDLVALQAIQIPQVSVPYLYYAGSLGMGPTNVDGVTVQGDAYSPVPFTPAITPPTVWHPVSVPNRLTQGQSASISYQMPQACYALLEIIQDSDVTPGVTSVKTLHDWTQRPAGVETTVWDGTTDDGSVAAPGVYLARVQAQYTLSGPVNYASTMVTVTA
ncbi:MAG: DUF362 domain-containing protein [Bryobacteraceae bacterium]